MHFPFGNKSFIADNNVFRLLFCTFADIEALFDRSNLGKPDEICKLVNRNPTKGNTYRKRLFIND